MTLPHRRFLAEVEHLESSTRSSCSTSPSRRRLRTPRPWSCSLRPARPTETRLPPRSTRNMASTWR